jgi:carboxypeptidase Q
MRSSRTAAVRAVAACLLFAASSPNLVAQAPPEVVAKILDEASPEKSEVMEHLRHLCIEIGPRLTGSKRLNLATDWAASKFSSYGLWTKLDKWDEIEVGFERGVDSAFAFWSDAPPAADDGDPSPRRGRRESSNGRRLSFQTGSWTAGTNGLKTGPALIVPKTIEELEPMKAAARGAWLFRVQGSVESRKLDAFVAETGAFGVISKGGDLMITSGNLRTKWESRPTVPRIRVHDGDYEFIKEKLEGGVEVVLGFDIQNTFTKGPVPVYNVLAELRGTEKPEEIVIVGGHIDSWDGAMGTTDNGTGTATTIEAARLLVAAGAKPKRTIRFMLWSGEEQGLLGSASYAKRHPEEDARISAVLVHDGGTNFVSGISGTKAMQADLATVFEPIKNLDPAYPFEIGEVRRLPAGIGSDHDTYVARGVPGFFWRQSGRANYTYTHHTQHDVLAAAIPEYQRRTSVVVAVGALGIANLPNMLDRSTTVGGVEPPSPLTSRRRLGVQLGDGLEVVEVSSQSPAETAGVKTGDVLLKVDDVEVTTVGELSRALNTGEPKKRLVVRRGDAQESMTVEWPK